MYTDNDWRNYELMHHGVRGMHWGILNGPPYPLSRAVSTGKALTSAAKGVGKTVGTAARKASDVYKAKRAEIQVANAQKKKERAEKRAEEQVVKEQKRAEARAIKAQKAEARAKEKEADRIAKVQKKEEAAANKLRAEKEKIIRSGDTNKIRKVQDRLSATEFEEAVKRCELNKRLHDSQYTEKTRADKAIDRVKNYTDRLNAGVNAWNAFAKVYNSFNEEPLPTINGKFNKKAAGGKTSTETGSSKKESKTKTPSSGDDFVKDWIKDHPL